MIDPFGTSYSQISWLNSTKDPSGIEVRAWTAHNQEIAQDVAYVAGALGVGVAFVATAPVTIPSCVAAALLGAVAGIAIGVLWNDTHTLPAQTPTTQPQPQPKPTAEVDAPADLLETAADSNPVVDENGDLGYNGGCGFRRRQRRGRCGRCGRRWRCRRWGWLLHCRNFHLDGRRHFQIHCWHHTNRLRDAPLGWRNQIMQNNKETLPDCP